MPRPYLPAPQHTIKRFLYDGIWVSRVRDDGSRIYEFVTCTSGAPESCGGQCLLLVGSILEQSDEWVEASKPNYTVAALPEGRALKYSSLEMSMGSMPELVTCRVTGCKFEQELHNCKETTSEKEFETKEAARYDPAP